MPSLASRKPPDWPTIRTSGEAYFAAEAPVEEQPWGAKVVTLGSFAVVVLASMFAPFLAMATRGNYLVAQDPMPERISLHLLSMRRPNGTAPEGLEDILAAVNLTRVYMALPMFCAMAVMVLMISMLCCSRSLVHSRTGSA